MKRKDAIHAGWAAATVLACLAGGASLLRAQANASLEVGIDEKLGMTAGLDVVLKDEEGGEVTLRQIVDKPTILTLNYFRCTGICTPLLNGMVDMVNRIRLEPGRDFRIVTVSFDPRDTPEIARQKRINYLARMKRPVDPQAWRFLTGDEAATRRLADSVGFRFRAEGDQYSHPGAVIFLSERGVVSRYMYGIDFLPADVEMAVREAIGGHYRPTVAKMLAFCYSYDPESRAYVFNLTRVIGAGTLIVVAGFGILVVRSRPRKAGGPGPDNARSSP